MNPATFCAMCGNQEQALYGPVPGSDDDFLCLGCAEAWGKENLPRVGASGVYVACGVEVIEGSVTSGEHVTVIEFGPFKPTECEHTHVEAMHRMVQSWN